MKKMECIRWAFHCGSWVPTQSEWMRAVQCIQPEEKSRISKFVFKRDAKASMTGRLLIRKCVHELLQIPFKQIEIKRTEKGKPYLMNKLADGLPNFSMNVSHHGGYAVLAADKYHLVGVDVMKVEWARGEKTIQSFFDTMSRQFTAMEWTFIKQPSTEWDQLCRFYRLWCLKESYVKALGIGIGFELQNINFIVHTSELSTNFVVCDTQIMVNGILEDDWIFEESMLDEEHCVAVASKRNENEKLNGDNCDKSRRKHGQEFQCLTTDDLISTVDPISAPDLDDWLSFNNKNENQFHR